MKNGRRILGPVLVAALLLIVIAWPGVGQTVHSIDLSWGTSVGATSYTVKRATVSGAETTLQSGVTTTAFSDTTGVAGTKYFYVVTASNSFGESGPSPEVSATFLGNPPVAPAGLAAVAK